MLRSSFLYNSVTYFVICYIANTFVVRNPFFFCIFLLLLETKYFLLLAADAVIALALCMYRILELVKRVICILNLHR